MHGLLQMRCKFKGTCSNHQGALNHLQLKGRLLVFPFGVVVMIAPVLCEHPGTFIGCQAGCHALQELLALRVVWLKQ